MTSAISHAAAPAQTRDDDNAASTGTTYRRYAIAWLGGPLIGIANGATRELTYKRFTGDLAGHQISSVIGIALFGAYFGWLARRWPIANARTALGVGAMWVALTVAFEFGFGHWVDRKSWSDLLRDYDVREGRVWGVVLLWIGLAPSVMRLLVRPRRETA